MHKDQFKLQVYNNRYIRGVIVAICKIIIWGLIYALVLSFAISMLNVEAGSTVLNGYASSPLNMGTIFAVIIIVAATGVFYWAVISEIVRKVKQNRQLTQLEDDYLNGKSSTGAKDAKSIED